MYMLEARNMLTIKKHVLLLLIALVLGLWLLPTSSSAYKKNSIHNITIHQTALIEGDNADEVRTILKKLQVMYFMISKHNFIHGDNSAYSVVVIPDNLSVDDDLSNAIASYIEDGGAVIVCGSWGSKLDDLQDASARTWGSSFLEQVSIIEKSRVDAYSRTFSALHNTLVSKVHALASARAAIRSQLRNGLSASATVDQAVRMFSKMKSDDGKDCAHDFGKGVMFFLHKAYGHNFSDATMDEFERFIRTHTDEFIIVRDRDHPHRRFEGVEVIMERPHHHKMNIFITPMHSFENTQLRIFFRPPTGKLVKNIQFSHGDHVRMPTTYTAFTVFDSEPTEKWQSGHYIVTLDNEYEESTTSENPKWITGRYEDITWRLFNFMKKHMRDLSKDGVAKYGIYTQYDDVPTTSDDPYAEGHHVTAEHMGLFLRTAVCLHDEKAFQQGFNYIKKLMQSPLTRLVNWAVNKHTDKPYIADQGANADAPLDDMRVIRGLLRGGHFLHSNAARRVGETALTALYWYGITGRGRVPDTVDVKDYYGISGYAFNWNETKSCPMKTKHIMDTHLLPVNYNDLYVFEKAARLNPRWIPILESSLQFILDSDIHGNGLFMNSYYPGKSGSEKWSGDFEYQEAGKPGRASHMKCIQSLWSAIHLANTYRNHTPLLSDDMKNKAKEAAKRAFRKWKEIYERYDGVVSEYLDFHGYIPEDGVIEGSYVHEGEPRIYALIARLSFLVDEYDFAHKVIEEKLLDFWNKQNDFPYVWGDVESFNVLETTLAICEVSGGKS